MLDKIMCKFGSAWCIGSYANEGILINIAIFVLVKISVLGSSVEQLAFVRKTRYSNYEPTPYIFPLFITNMSKSRAYISNYRYYLSILFLKI